MTNPVGRPSKYTPEFLKEAEEYLETYESEHQHAIPNIVGLALVLDLHRDTIREWGNDENKKEFSAILEKINQKQQQVLITKGLEGAFNSNITKLVLGKHGFHDKQETEHTGKDGGPIATTFNFLPVNNKSE